MQRARRPWIAAGAALTGASMIAATPTTTVSGLPEVQQRPVQLKSYEEYDLSQLLSASEANFSGLESALSSSRFLTDPDISQGFSTVLSDLATGASNPVTNPISLLIEGSLGLLSPGYSLNAAITALTGVSDNVQAALSSSDYSAALTDLENEPTTLLYAFLNGYPQTLGSDLFSPQFGLLTNTTDGAATGQIDALQQISNTLADEFASAGGANLTTGPLSLLSGNLDLSLNLNQILSDLGLGSAGSLTINGLLGDLGLSPTGNIVPSLTIGDVLNDLGLSNTSSISLTNILEDLGVIGAGNTDPTFNIDTLAGEIFSALNIPTSINADTLGSDIFSALGIPTTFNLDTLATDLFHDLSIPSSINVDTLATDIFSGLGIPTTFNLDTLATDLFNDLGLSTSITGDSLATDIFNALGISSFNLSSVLGDLGLTGTATIPTSEIESLLGISGTLATLLNAADPHGISVNIGNLLSDVTSALGLNSTFNPVTIVTDLLGSSGSNPITLDEILGDLGVGSGSTDSLSNILSDLGISSSSSITLDQILGDLGINSGSTDSLSNILSDLGISSSSTLTLDNILSDLGVTSSSSIDLNHILGDLGFPANGSINLGDILNLFHLSDTSPIPLPSVSIDSLLSALGVNPNESVLSLLGIGNMLSLSPTLDLTGGSVPTYDLDLAQDLLAVLGSFAPLSSDLPSLLTTDPTLSLAPILGDLLADLGAPAAITGGDLSANLTNIGAELLAGLF